MKVKHSQKMKLKKATIAQINQTTAMLVKGGTRGNSTLFDDSAMVSHCADIVCY
ncbi:hypothetical protein H2O64_07220 [Kordia sp. YSTF-M3]|uniref:Natural product n=1 Tax=Kordia aestuariivivens TaxID=2759037 RepID=A0ABR7Q7A8_9FLAO|nr:hypothetical protein [Kordia aestuariivivens]MBC8754457.1 hypothetical protein [Kordia aestuariivivens]